MIETAQSELKHEKESLNNITHGYYNNVNKQTDVQAQQGLSQMYHQYLYSEYQTNLYLNLISILSDGGAFTI